MEIKVTSPRQLSGWISGRIGKYTFSAKVYDMPSKFGINGGRVSKLGIYGDEERKCKGWITACIVNYDRGWDVQPESEEHRGILRDVLQFLEALPDLGGVKR